MQSDLIESRARPCEPDVPRRPPQSVIRPIFRICCNEKKENEDINHLRSMTMTFNDPIFPSAKSRLLCAGENVRAVEQP